MESDISPFRTSILEKKRCRGPWVGVKWQLLIQSCCTHIFNPHVGIGLTVTLLRASWCVPISHNMSDSRFKFWTGMLTVSTLQNPLVNCHCWLWNQLMSKLRCEVLQRHIRMTTAKCSTHNRKWLLGKHDSVLLDIPCQWKKPPHNHFDDISPKT